MKLPKFKKEKKQDEKLNKISNPETGSALEREREREREREVTFTGGEKNRKILVKNKKKVIILAIIVLVGLFALAMINTNIRESVKNGFGAIAQSVRGGDTVESGIDTLAENNEIGDKGYISSAQIIQTKTGTGPWDADDEPGNDSSEDNNIVRSFDQITWTVDLTMALKDGVAETGLTGGVINVEVSLPEDCADVMEWDLDSMNWIENGQVSSDGRILTGQYSMSTTDTTVPGKQTLVFVLGVEGAANETEIIPTFKFDLEENEENDKFTTTGEKVIVSAAGKYNIQLVRNASLANKTTVDYGQGETNGRMYGYSFTVQLYNNNESKGLKGVEYPKGEISFDINLKLERSKFESSELEDITDEALPILWNYRINDWTMSNLSGNIENRTMYSNTSNGDARCVYCNNLPLGNYRDDTSSFEASDYCVYNSGDINIVQDGSLLHVTINNYDFNGKFPLYGSANSGNAKTKIYTDNIGTFSVGYMQIFVPDTDASTIGDRNYYLTISDNNMKITSLTNETINTQMSTLDDSLGVQHVLYNPGSYSQCIYLFTENRAYGSVESNLGAGDGRANLGQIIRVTTKFSLNSTNDDDIYTANRFVKFDGEGYEPVYFSDGSKYKTQSMSGNAKFKVWYVTKKDGTNWVSQEEMNNGNIEDMDIYENIEDIPKDKVCIGMYFETISGYISKESGINNELYFMLKIRETATIGKTYGMTQSTVLWKEALDRSIYTITNTDIKYLEDWPTPEWNYSNRQYVKTEYDENGKIISGTHNGGSLYGNTILVVGANLHGNIKSVDENNAEKVNYDLGKNENTVTYSVEPQLDANTNLSAQIENVTLKAEVTLPLGLTYIPGSCEYGEPEVTDNSDGTQTLVWHIYGVTSGQNIDPIKFDVQIDNESANGQQYTAKFVISEVIGSDGISKIGNSEIDFRTTTETINIINLASHRLYKEVETPIIEKNGQIKYTISYVNNTEDAVSDFQLLDILPYNGDSRGTNFVGTYNVSSINVTETIGGSAQETSNLKLYTTNSDTVRSMDSKNTGIGTDSIWAEKAIGNTLNESATGFAIKGELAGKAKLEIEVTLNTSGNTAENVYANNAMAQVYTESEQMQTGTVRSQVVSRKIQGKVWEDSNRNGIMDTGEELLAGVVVKLLNSTTSAEVARTTTNAEGEYEFTDLAKGTYKVEVETDITHELTDKEVGTNREINSKFNQDIEQTDEITKLNTIQSPEIIEDNVNAGIRLKEAEITSNISKTGTDKITSKDDVVTYAINYKTTIDTYRGNAKVTIVDELPYKIDLQKSNLDGGTYDEETQTITWVESISDIDTYTNGPKDIDISKNITVVYTNLDVTKESFDNKAQATILLDATDQQEDTEEVKVTTTTEFKVDVTVTKTWDHTNNIYTIPDSVILQVKNGDKVVRTQTVTSANAVDGNQNVWSYTFTDLDKYDENGNEITYTAGEAEVTSGNLSYYKATVDGTNITNTYNGPVISQSKSFATENGLSYVVEGEKITYTVTVKNNGGVAKDVTVQDSVPEGTTFVENSIKVNNSETSYTESDLNSGITVNVAEKSQITVSFEVTVNYAKDEFTIKNVATVDGKNTNETEIPYVKPDPKVESTLAKNGTDKVTSKDQVVNYEVKYLATVNDFKGTAKVTIVDTLPYAIDVSNSKLDNGTYNPDNNTITWEQEIDVDTFATDVAKDIAITKSIEVKYIYGDINETTGKMLNTVNSKIELIETEGEDPVLTDEKESEKETLIEIPAEVIVHHYICDAETDTYTTIKLAPDKTIDGIIGQNYTTTKSDQVPSNYSCVNEQPENYAGKMTEDTIEVNYYYSLITPTITNTMDKTAIIGRPVMEVSLGLEESSETVPVLTKENGEISYFIDYTGTIDNYKGKATVVIVDTLPAQIDVDKSDLDGGIYNSTYKTITWEETIEDIDTFTNGTYYYGFYRTITLVYTGQNMAEDLSNTVVGTVNVYYPEEHSSKPGEVQETETAEDTAVVKQDYKVDLKVEKVWDDNDNQKGHRPDGIIVTIAGGDLDNKQVELNDSNNWNYEEKGLDKYDENGNLINYSVAESEKNPGDLQYYTARLTELNTNDPAKETYRFTNTYKLTQADLDASITKTGTEEITVSTEPVSYEINFTSTVKEYIGDGKVIITDTLPYRIDETNSNLDGGTYDDEAKTITWKEDLTDIDTFVNGDYSINITKNISVVFVDLDASGESFTNTVLGKVRLYETEQEDQATDSSDTLININGDVIVKYVDIDTNEEISDRVTLNGKVGDKYTTSRKQIDTYDYVNCTPNTEGLIIEETQEVIYYYQRKAAQVIVKYQDTDGNSLTEDITIDGKVGDEYTTEQKEFENYEFVSVTENAEGTMKEETITVIYVYQKIPTKVIVQYLEKDTNNVLAEEDEIDGFAGDSYTTDRKMIENYQSAEPEPENKTGLMTKDVITVIYYYERIPAGDLIVKYVDIDTDEEIVYIDQETGEEKTYGYTITGFVGDNYETEQKDIPYYNFIRSTSNTKGQLTEAGDTVIYYYQKQKFNLGITKSISEITLDGSNRGVGDGKTSKVEIHRKKINTANLEVKYKIVVSNTGEIPGTAKVIDKLPSGYIVSSNNPIYWTSSNGNLETTVELQPGETKELEVVLKWLNGESSFGTGENIARITDISNPANYAETTEEDNEDSATLVTSVETGINRNVYLIITTCLLMIVLVVLLYLHQEYQKERKGEKVSKKTLKLKNNDKK